MALSNWEEADSVKAKLETTQVYVESTPKMIKDNYRRALTVMRVGSFVKRCRPLAITRHTEGP
jgi:hypothetical protein